MGGLSIAQRRMAVGHKKARAGRALLVVDSGGGLFGNRATCAVQADAFVFIHGVSGDFFSVVAEKYHAIVKAVAGSGGCLADNPVGGAAIRLSVLGKFALG